MTEQEILDRLEVLRKKKLELYFEYETLKKSAEPEDIKKFQALKTEIAEIKKEFGKLMVQKTQIDLEKKSQL